MFFTTKNHGFIYENVYFGFLENGAKRDRRLRIRRRKAVFIAKIWL